MRDPRKPVDRDLYDLLNPEPEWGEHSRWEDEFTPPPEEFEEFEDPEEQDDGH